MSSTTIDLEARNAYEYLGVLIQAWEESALNSGTRVGAMASLQSPLAGMESGLAAGRKVLSRVGNTRKSMGPSGTHEEQSRRKSGFEKAVEEGVHFDADLAELMGINAPVTSTGPNGETITVLPGNYLEDCLGCTLRLRFDWQLKPLDLLGPLNAFLDSINAALDRLLKRLDPFKLLEDLCDFLNGFNAFCPQDLIMMIMGLRLLLKKYLMLAFRIKLDWTTLLGPLVKLIVEGITALLEQLLMLMLAPIDCAINSLETINTLYIEARSLVSTIAATDDRIKSVIDQAKAAGTPVQAVGGSTVADVNWSGGENGPYVDPVTGEEIGAVQASTQSGNQGLDLGNLGRSDRFLSEPKTVDKSFTFGTGFDAAAVGTLLDAFQDPAFNQSTPFDQLIVPLKEARQWLLETEESLVGSLNSLNLLVGGGLSLNLDNVSIIMFIMDMISLVIMIVRMKKEYPDIRDWCEELRKHPEIVQEHLRLHGVEDVQVELQDKDLMIRRGPEIVGTVRTCVNSRTAVDNQLLSTWINDLRSTGALT